MKQNLSPPRLLSECELRLIEYLLRACPYLDNEAKNRLNRQQNKANCADNIGILSNNLTQFCQI